MKKIITAIENFLIDEQSRLNLWLPVLFGIGIALYFVLPFEPKLEIGLVAVLISFTTLFFVRHKVWTSRFILGLCFLVVGFSYVQLKAHLMAAPRLDYNHSFVMVQGEIEQSEILPSGQRLTLSHILIENIPPTQMPRKVRLRINGLTERFTKGDIIQIKANLMPPNLPAEPDSYAYCRRAWFDQIGAVGYAMGKPTLLKKATNQTNMFEQTRQRIATRVLHVLDKDEANIVLPLIIGEQSAVPQSVYDAYRDAGIAHVLSVSGLHMMLVAGIVFSFLRFFMALIPSIALRFNIKKIAAVVALIITFFYLMISGMAVPAQRSYIMLFVVFFAIVVDRQALSVRNVCWVGFIVLLLQPESIISASFQLSFAAVLALICAFEAAKQPMRLFLKKRTNPIIKWVLAFTCSFLLVNLVAGLATTPYALFHFHRYPTYGILGNFLTSSLFAVVIMPLLLISVVLMPFGWDIYPLKAAGFCLDIVGDITVWIAHLPFASVLVPAMPIWGLIFCTFGGLWLCLWQTRPRFLGILFIVIGTFSFLTHHSPDIFISQGGQLIGVYDTTTKQMSFTSLTKKKRYRRMWMESNGLSPDTQITKIEEDLITIKGKKIALSYEACSQADIAILTQKNTATCSAPVQLRYRDLWRKGTHTIDLTAEKITNSADSMGQRLWYPQYRYMPFLLDFIFHSDTLDGKRRK